MNIRVKWTGSYPNLCYGEWTLIIDGEDKSNLIPEDLKDRPMNTFGIYSKRRFLDRESWEIIWEEYEDGMECNEWIENNKYWLDNISTDYDIQEQLFYAFADCDWRHGSCGGCI